MEFPAWPEELLGPPEVEVPPIDWAQAQARTGLRFPPDYRELAQSYPALIIYDGIAIWHPLAPPWCNLVDPQDMLVDQWRSWDPPEEIIECDPATGQTRHLDPALLGNERFYPWGRDFGSPRIGLWLVDGDPDRWSVVLADRVVQWRYRGPLTQFVPDVISGWITCPGFPEDWFDPDDDGLEI
jgi:hypothetical protein